jgi:hypothetical protein
MRIKKYQENGLRKKKINCKIMPLLETREAIRILLRSKWLFKSKKY